MKKEITNVAASVHARLLNRAKAERRPFNELLQYYAMERFLYRLSRSEHADRFVLKGALMLQFWGGALTRATKDIDLLGRSTVSVTEIVDVVRSCLAAAVDDDGLRFDPARVIGEEIRLAANYDGVRVRCGARLGNARVAIQVDVGFGDVVTPGAQDIEYPTLLDSAAPRLLGYTPETAIAEKLEAMVVLDMANTRMKDFLDIWILAQGRAFAGGLLAQAIEATFRRRGTALPESTPVALTPAFHSAKVKQTQWRAYLRKGRIQGDVPDLHEVAARIESFLMPVVTALTAGQAFTHRWPPGGPWGDPSEAA
ncbi:MAG: nucleotidyl transferase AbiEii/AbiGii toxin family protein [Myxococcota bacterium]